MSSQAEKEYAAFEEKVRRTVYLDNLSTQVTESVLRSGLGQFGNVKSAQFIPNYLEPKNIPQCALVEMQNPKQAKAAITAMTEYPFMMSGMPRPVRACPAEMEMFDDRPNKPGRKIKFRWLEKNDPDYETSNKLKQLTQKHAAEAAFLHEKLLVEEHNLADQQAKILKANHKKYETVSSIMGDGSSHRLAKRYGMSVRDN